MALNSKGYNATGLHFAWGRLHDTRLLFASAVLLWSLTCRPSCDPHRPARTSCMAYGLEVAVNSLYV
eukprot:1809153-Karenia_brevis.AAC.1